MVDTKKMLVICPYPEDVAPSQRLTFEQYYNYFREQGYEVETSSFISKEFWQFIYKKGNVFSKVFYTGKGYWQRMKDLLRLRHYDVVYVHLWVTPFGPPIFEWLFRKVAKKIIYDIDDLVYIGQKNKAHPFVSVIKGKKKPIQLIKHADHVITCTPYLDQFVRKFNQHTTDISVTINTKRYQPKTDYSTIDKFTIGWSGSHSTSKYLHLLDDVLRELATEIEFKLLVMGDVTFTIPGVEVEALPWKEEYEVDTISRFDVGLYPLPDEEWVLGKSGGKALQYMALGVPTVATAIGAIYRIINDGENGFLAASQADWKAHLLKLSANQALRERVGKAAAATVQQRFSVDANNEVYLSILNKVTEAGRD